MHDGLGSATPDGIGRITVEPVLGGHQIDGTQGFVAEVVDDLMSVAERVGLEGVTHPLLDPDGLGQSPGVDRLRFDRFEWHAISFHLEVREISQQESERVADLPVALAGDLEEVQVDLDVVLEGKRADPPATDIGTEVLEKLVHAQGVARGLGHLPTFSADSLIAVPGAAFPVLEAAVLISVVGEVVTVRSAETVVIPPDALIPAQAPPIGYSVVTGVRVGGAITRSGGRDFNIRFCEQKTAGGGWTVSDCLIICTSFRC